MVDSTCYHVEKCRENSQGGADFMIFKDMYIHFVKHISNLGAWRVKPILPVEDIGPSQG